MADLDIDQIRAAHEAATPGPYRWTGNTDNDEVRLIGLGRRKTADGRSLGRGDVLAVIRRERTSDSPGARGYANYIGDCEQVHDPSLNDGKGGYRQPTDGEVEQRVRDEWLTDQWGEPAYDNALTVYDPERGAHEFALDLAVYEVARNQGLPDDTPRSHPKVYRADVVDVRNPNARFLRDSWEYVRFLLDEVDRLAGELDKRGSDHA
jgi:hypothetical protein